MKIFSREPAAIVNVASMGVALLVAFDVFGLTEDRGQAVIGVFSAATTVFLLFQVRPIAPTVLTGLITAGVAFMAAFDLVHITQRQTGLIVAFAEVFLTALIIRPQSTPVADPRPATNSV